MTIKAAMKLLIAVFFFLANLCGLRLARFTSDFV
jgi:hypothetical protein